jgi:hypothetical protein
VAFFFQKYFCHKKCGKIILKKYLPQLFIDTITKVVAKGKKKMGKTQTEKFWFYSCKWKRKTIF